MKKHRRREPQLEQFEQLLRIDGDALEEEVVRHPEIYYHVLNGLRSAERALKDAKEDLSDIESALNREIREEAEANGTRITVDAVRAEVHTRKSYRDSRDVFSAYEEDYKRWVDLKDAFIQRSYALRELVELYTTSYYASMEQSSGQQGSAHERAQRRRVRLQR